MFNRWDLTGLKESAVISSEQLIAVQIRAFTLGYGNQVLTLASEVLWSISTQQKNFDIAIWDLSPGCCQHVGACVLGVPATGTRFLPLQATFLEGPEVLLVAW